MLCPNCGQQVTVRNVDNEIVLHCSTCGSSFFDKGGIDRITVKSARILAEEAQGQYVLGNQKICPKDKSVLLEKVDPNLPKNTILLECPSCVGVFAYPDDLLKYKGIKAALPLSVGTFKLLPAPKSLFMLATFAVLSITVLLNVDKFSTNTKASGIYGTVHLTKSARFFSVQFTTQDPIITSIIFFDKNKKETFRQIVSATPSKVHQVLTITQYDAARDVSYAIQLGNTQTPIAPVVLEK